MRDIRNFDSCWMAGASGDERTEEERRRSKALVERALAGDPDAFGQIVVEHERRVFNLAYRLLGTIEDAHDASQDVFLKAYRYLHRFDAARPLAPWLMRITVNTCRDLGRRHRPTTDQVPERPSPEGNPHVELALEEERRTLNAALERLPYKERTAIVLRDIEGLPTREVADILRSSEVTVRVQISRARLKLRLLLRKEGEGS